MIKPIISIILNLFNFNKPRFAQLRYTDVVVGDEAYFLITWELEGAYRLKIDSLNYRTFKNSGSAYIAIPAGIDQLELVIAGVWWSERKAVVLLRQPVASQVNFFPVKQYKEVAAVYAPELSGRNINPQIPVFAIRTKNLTKT